MSDRPISLLIVDDDPVFARFVEQLVRSLGSEMPCEPRRADTASRALAELGQHAYELVLLDYNLPDSDGLNVLSQIRELPAMRQPAVIMLTASGNETVAVEAMKRGARDYLAKADLDVGPLMRAIQCSLTQKQLADQVASYNHQMQEDLAMARQLQLALLPTVHPCFPPSVTPEHSALRFHHRFHPATELAGDLFSVMALSDYEAGVFICDVMGHGIRSALVTALLRAMVDDLAPAIREPGAFLAEMNRKLTTLIKPAGAPLFATAFYLVADVRSGQMQFANAGHPRPLHLEPRSGLLTRLQVNPHSGPALGLSGDSTYATACRPLAPGDRILLFTDGLFEVLSADGSEDFSQARLVTATREHLQMPLPALLDQLLAEVRLFTGGAEFNDDVCLLGMEAAWIEPPDGSARLEP